jgi:hypothetical protein
MPLPLPQCLRLAPVVLERVQLLVAWGTAAAAAGGLRLVGEHTPANLLYCGVCRCVPAWPVHHSGLF